MIVSPLPRHRDAGRGRLGMKAIGRARHGAKGSLETDEDRDHGPPGPVVDRAGALWPRAPRRADSLERLGLRLPAPRRSACRTLRARR